ncbi:hypothetical protein L6452_03496 [Arctium lappa]|uniref:Uncharacterized protein n=1 Tax=Arctium lappa TaxID=4217 RepID=A0ACB9FLU9_ARCLA|nr:hypothetical protein L6452_03496 [Arctium lappa]
MVMGLWKLSISSLIFRKLQSSFCRWKGSKAYAYEQVTTSIWSFSHELQSLLFLNSTKLLYFKKFFTCNI